MKQRKFKQTLSNRKTMAEIFFDRKGILLTKFMVPSTTTRDVCCETLTNIRKSIKNKGRRLLTQRVIFLRDNDIPLLQLLRGDYLISS